MLESYPMVVKDNLLFLPDELKEGFLATGPLPLRDGTQVTPEEIWHFMTVEGPARFPYAFTANPSAPTRMPLQVDLLSSIKMFYLLFSRRFRVESLRQQGKPLVYVQGGQTLVPYYAADAVPMRPGDLAQLTSYYVAEGLGLRDRDWKALDIQEEGSRAVSVEACHQLGTHSAIRTGILPVALLAPYTKVRCSDVTFLVESHRDGPMGTPSLLVDYPVNYEPRKTWMVEYVAAGLRRLVARIDSLTGRTTTEEDFRAQIRLNNRVRRLAREIIHLWRCNDAPPASSFFFSRAIVPLGKDCDADPIAAEHVLSQMRGEIEERVRGGLKGSALSRRPVRIFKCGSCFNPNLYKLDKCGGALVGMDDWCSDVLLPDIDEDGDPYVNYARTTLAAPYDLATEQRARFAVEQIKESRAEGVIFGYQWGCNFQSGVARMVCDIIQKESGVPAMTLSTDELGRGESLEQTDNRIEAFVEMLSM